MNALIYFDESSRVEPHTVDMRIVPRPGDFFDLPDVGSGRLFPVERVIFLLTRGRSGGKTLEVPSDSPQVRIHLGASVDDKSK